MKTSGSESAAAVDRGWLVVLLSVSVTLWGLAGIYSVNRFAVDWERFLWRQGCWTLAGVGVMLAIWRCDFDGFRRHAEALTLVAWAALAGLFWWGTSINGMRGWYDLGWFNVQVSELAKGIFVLLAVKLTVAPEAQWRRLLKLGAIAGGYWLLILAQPDFGTAAVYGAGLLIVLFLAGVRKLVLAGAVLAGLAGTGLLLLRHGYMWKRVWSFVEPGFEAAASGWHWRQFEICFARGGWFGVKDFQAVWCNRFLPLPHNDSIFAAMGEVLGVCGTGLLLFLYGCLFYQLFRLGGLASGMRRRFIDAGTGLLMAQVLLHIYVNLALLPPTGVTLPLVSYGGSSLVGTMILLGLMLSAARRRE